MTPVPPPVTPPEALPPAPPWPAAAELPPARPRAWRRALPWVVLVALLGIAQTLLIVLSLEAESTRLQEESDRTAVAVAADLRLRFGRHQQALQGLSWAESPAADAASAAARGLLRERRDMLRIELRDAQLELRLTLESPFRGPLFAPAGGERMSEGLLPRAQLDLELQLACTSARRLMLPRWSRSYFVPQPGGLGLEVVDLCMPLIGPQDAGGYVVATVALGLAIEEAVPPAILRSHELALVEGDGTRLVRVGGPRGAGVYLAERLLDLPGLGLALRVDTDRRGPPLIPNLSTGLVVGLSLALAAVVALLVRDVRRRAAAEQRLAEELALRRAMEDSLVTGLRARDLLGRITYVNPAFCAMVGFPPHELVGQLHPPYWPPEQRALYEARWSERLTGQLPPREGFETLFMRADGERFPVLVFEAPLVDAQGRQAGWMSAVLDVSAQRRAEELARQQQDKLQTAARLATVGEIATLLSHELNQPLAAIASYATGSLNLLGGPPPAEPPATPQAGAEPPDAPTFAMIREAVQRIAEQAERAGRVIKGVHDVVRRREQPREALPAALLFEAVLPLVQLQARRSGTRVALDLPRSRPEVRCDRTMIEQVLLNLTRNAVHAMEAATPPEQRKLTLRVREEAATVRFEVVDRGPGIPDEVAAQLFTPFFTTKAEGMGLGLNFCRTVIEQHGGTLRHAPAPVAGAGPRAAPGLRGSCFSFTLPRVAAPESSPP